MLFGRPGASRPMQYFQQGLKGNFVESGIQNLWLYVDWRDKAIDLSVKPSIKHMKQQKVIVIGASMAGLLAARICAQHFSEVLILEKDAINPEIDHRKSEIHSVFNS